MDELLPFVVFFVVVLSSLFLFYDHFFVFMISLVIAVVNGGFVCG